MGNNNGSSSHFPPKLFAIHRSLVYHHRENSSNHLQSFVHPYNIYHHYQHSNDNRQRQRICQKVTGHKTIDNVKVYFDKDGKQAKGIVADDGYYYDKNTGELVDLGRDKFVDVIQLLEYFLPKYLVIAPVEVSARLGYLSIM